MGHNERVLRVRRHRRRANGERKDRRHVPTVRHFVPELEKHIEKRWIRAHALVVLQWVCWHIRQRWPSFELWRRPMQTVEIRELNGLRHQVRVHDDGRNEQTLVVLHGFLDSAAAFAPFIEELATRYRARIVAPDFRGHGGTEWVGRGGYYHFADYVADVHALIQSEKALPVALLGHSMGGSVAALVAGAFPELVSRLVLVEGLGATASDATPPDRMRQWIKGVDAQRDQSLKPMSLADATRRLQRVHPRVDAPTLERLAEVSTREVEGGRAWAYDPLHRTRSPMPIPTADFKVFLSSIACPSLLVDGSESPFRQWINDKREDAIKDLKQVRIPDAGHMIHLEQAQALADVVADFLNG